MTAIIAHAQHGLLIGQRCDFRYYYMVEHADTSTVNESATGNSTRLVGTADKVADEIVYPSRMGEFGQHFAKHCGAGTHGRLGRARCPPS